MSGHSTPPDPKVDYMPEKNGQHFNDAEDQQAPRVPLPNHVVQDDSKHPPIVYERDNVLGPGLRDDAVYDAQMSWWRAGLRRILRRNLKTESQWIAALQDRVRTPALDTYFVYTSTLGTHTFFMTMLPAFFFFGHDEAGASLILVLGLGVYLSSLIKDSVCSPRPFAPPVTRLTVGSHHLEYGFPSTHSTNSVSIALHFWSIFHALHQKAFIPDWAYFTSIAVLVWYAFSIVFGRLYCGMHSFTDCTVGVILGSAIWVAQWTWGAALDAWVRTPGWQVPLISIPLTLILVNQHPDPVDDCPCFEDSIAFLAVIMGCTLATWWRANWGYGWDSGFFQIGMPQEWMMWLLIAAAKMILGVLIIFTFRLAAKPILHAVLPPIFRGLSTLFTLPNRRYYTAATDYQSFPSENLLYDPIPSVIDLPALASQEGILLPTSRSRGRSIYGQSNLKQRHGHDPIREHVTFEHIDGDEKRTEEVEPEKVKHYDADVLTKVIVYAGIGFIAAGLAPVLFEYLGWGVYSTLPAIA